MGLVNFFMKLKERTITKVVVLDASYDNCFKKIPPKMKEKIRN